MVTSQAATKITEASTLLTAAATKLSLPIGATSRYSVADRCLSISGMMTMAASSEAHR
jgi:hypothetical protein